MKRIMVGMCLALTLPSVAFAHGGIDAAKRSLEATMLVTGEIAINPDGSVYGYSLDDRNKLPPDVAKLVDGTLSGWKFDPVEVAGKDVRARTRMSLRVVAYQDKPGHFVATVEGAAFGGGDYQPGVPSSYGDGVDEGLSYINRTPPEYPQRMIDQRVGATVYMVVEVNQAGHVADAVVRQVNVRKLGTGSELREWRAAFAKASLAVVHTWTFNVPTHGPIASAHQWFVTVPINYSLQAWGQPPPPLYKWDAYVPGPVNPLPWQSSAKAEAAISTANDAIPNDGRPFVADTRFVLLTSLDSAASASQTTGQSKTN